MASIGRNTANLPPVIWWFPRNLVIIISHSNISSSHFSFFSFSHSLIIYLLFFIFHSTLRSRGIYQGIIAWAGGRVTDPAIGWDQITPDQTGRRTVGLYGMTKLVYVCTCIQFRWFDWCPGGQRDRAVTVITVLCWSSLGKEQVHGCMRCVGWMSPYNEYRVRTVRTAQSSCSRIQEIKISRSIGR